jgi:uncharacterized protein YggE
MKKLLAAAAAALTIVGLSIAPAEAATTKAQITVTGTGQVSVKRDQATTTLTVAVFDTTAKAAMAGATRNFNSVRAAIIAAGAREDDLTTAGLSLYPEYDYSSGKTPMIIGYRASVALSVVTAVNLAATIVDTAVETGGDTVSINGISFDTANPDASSATARSRAVAAAKAKARAYAKELGMKLGKVVKITETSAPIPTPIYAGADKVLASSVALDPGTAKVSVTVEVSFSLL